ncbi:integrase [Desulfuromonas versatilis]|uniref:Integrase n=1 Tax=Desulfuromonas versatilis TaxID=2802975 RepID=A0ABN6DS82_9BACT|nr:site-specific integrase [Desulfuromonas versatilis]BCR03068.1 integrase [Desulfuromonas versatilis]
MAVIQERKTKDGKIKYRVLVRMKGCPPQSATFTRKTDAKKWAQDTESAIRDGRHFKTAEAKKHTLGELIDRYLRDVLPHKSSIMSKQKVQYEWWKEQLGYSLLSDLTPALVTEYRDKLLRTPTPTGDQRSPATVNRYMAALSHALNVAVKEWGWIEDSPMRKISKLRESKGVVRYLDDDERERLLKACQKSDNKQLYTVVVLALSTGARKMEILGLTWKDVDLNAGVIRLTKTKNGECRVLPLRGHAKELVVELSKVRRLDTALLFPGNNPKSPMEIRKPWVAALEQASIEDFRFHDLRHTAASYLAMNGATLAEIAEVLGHKTLAMVKRYSHLSEAHTAGVVERMNEKIFGEG